MNSNSHRILVLDDRGLPWKASAENSPSHRILVIDDDPGLHAVLNATLGKDYAVEQAVDGVSGIEAARRQAPDLILLDIAMPGMPGYETCMRLKKEESCRAVPVIFLSALAELDDRLAAYEAGADDFIAKPFDPEELLDKVEVALGWAQERQQLAEQASSAFATAMTAMSSASEIGLVMDFMRRSYACERYEQVCDIAIEACTALGINACILVRAAVGTVSRNRTGASSPMEASVLTTLSSCGRIVTLGSRVAINYPHVTLMVTDMPIDSPNRAGSLRDDLAWLAEAADSMVAALDNQFEVQHQKEQLAALVERTRAALFDIERRHQQQKASTIEVMQRMADDIGTSFYGLGLSEQQEVAVAATLQQTIQQVYRLFNAGLAIDSHLCAINAELAGSKSTAGM